MKIRVTAVVLATIALSTGIAFGETAPDYYPMKIEIINKDKLPPTRLADALYAKAVLEDEDDRDQMFTQAAKLNPSDPVYSYQLIQEVPYGSVSGSNGSDKETQDRLKKLQDNARMVLNSILAEHPNYLPALYKQALLEPSLEQQLKALEKAAKIDKDNALPYYIMAMLKTQNLKRVDGVMSVSDDEWNAITALISKGNSKPNLELTYPRSPSAKDIKVTINGKTVPTDAVENILAFAPGVGENPVSFDAAGGMRNSTLRALTRQAPVKASLWDSQNKSSEAVTTLGIYAAFSNRLATAKPYRLLHYMIASAIRQTIIDTELDILKKMKSDTKLAGLEKEKRLWDAEIDKNDDSMALIAQPVKGVEIAPGEPLVIYRVAAEEALVSKILKELGLGAGNQ